MPHFKANIENLTLHNNYFRKVLFTSKLQQLVIMSIQDEIGEEIHPHNDQFIRIEQGKGIAIISDKKHYLKDGDCLIIPKGTKHNIINTSHTEDLKLYTIYSPPHHSPDTKEKYNIL